MQRPRVGSGSQCHDRIVVVRPKERSHDGFVLTASAPTNRMQDLVRIVLGSFMLLAGISHLSFRRVEFQAQVPPWVPLDPDFVVLASGVLEIILGSAMILCGRWRVWIGCALAVFYIMVFPGNISQYARGIDAFGLNTESARLIRLFFQPVLVALALWSTGALRALFPRRHPR